MDAYHDEESSPLFPDKAASVEKNAERKFSIAFKATLAFSMAILLVFCVVAYKNSSIIVSNENYIDVVKSTELQVQVSNRQDYLCMGQFLAPGQSLYSTNGQVRLSYQEDGNLVIYKSDNGVLWSPNCYGSGASQAILQNDGNFVVYSPRGAKYASGTDGKRGVLILQNDGNLVLYASNGNALWASGSNKINAANSNVGASICFAPTFSPTAPPIPPTPSPTQGVKAFNRASVTKGTGWSGDGTLNFLDRHNVNCDGLPLQGFRLQRKSNDVQIQYSCASTGNVATSTYGYDSGFQSYGGVIYLDRQDVLCPSSPQMFMNQFGGKTGYWWWGSQFKFEFKCSTFNVQKNSVTCRDYDTDWDDPGPRDSLIFLDRHNVQCPQNSALTGFKGQTGCFGWFCRTVFRYKYYCCSADTNAPTPAPIATPTLNPTALPISYPTLSPTQIPTYAPTPLPIANPTGAPIAKPTEVPTLAPIADPTAAPIADPTFTPTLAPRPDPTFEPTMAPIAHPTLFPTLEPTGSPQAGPTEEPVANPTMQPSHEPTKTPISNPTKLPTFEPSEKPTHQPTLEPTHMPSDAPSPVPTFEPTREPTDKPIAKPTLEPTNEPSHRPSPAPSMEPTVEPTNKPISLPTTEPIASPTFEPSAEPTLSPEMPPTSLTPAEIDEFKAQQVVADVVPNPPSEPVVIMAPAKDNDDAPKSPPDSPMAVEINHDIAAASKEDVSKVPLYALDPAEVKTQFCGPVVFVKSASWEYQIPRGCALIAKDNIENLNVGEVTVAAYICSIDTAPVNVDTGKLASLGLVVDGVSQVSFIAPGKLTSIQWFVLDNQQGPSSTFTSGWHPDLTDIHLKGSNLGNDAVFSMIMKSTATTISMPPACSSQK